MSPTRSGAERTYTLTTLLFFACLTLSGCPAETETPSATADASSEVTADGAGDTVVVPPLPDEVPACGSATLLESSDDASATGPWKVGARTVTVGRLTVEVWYPVVPGQEAGFDPVGYDLREQLAAEERDKITDASYSPQPCDCYKDAPIDGVRGAFPVVVFIHGTASFRTQSLRQMVHWASRGFVVVAADHPGLKLSDLLSVLCPHEASGDRDITADVSAMLTALNEASGDLAFLAGRVDMERVAITGHSAGGNASAELADQPGVRVVIPMASSGAPVSSGLLKTTLFLAGSSDGIVPLTDTVTAYESTSGNKRLVVLDNAGHLAFSDLCSTTNDAGEDILTIASNAGICGTELGAALFDCSPTLLDPLVGQGIVDHVTTLTLEEHLHCRARQGDPWADVLQRFPDVSEIRQSPN